MFNLIRFVATLAFGGVLGMLIARGSASAVNAPQAADCPPMAASTPTSALPLLRAAREMEIQGAVELVGIDGHRASDNSDETGDTTQDLVAQLEAGQREADEFLAEATRSGSGFGTLPSVDEIAGKLTAHGFSYSLEALDDAHLSPEQVNEVKARLTEADEEVTRQLRAAYLAGGGLPIVAANLTDVSLLHELAEQAGVRDESDTELDAEQLTPRQETFYNTLRNVEGILAQLQATLSPVLGDQTDDLLPAKGVALIHIGR